MAGDPVKVAPHVYKTVLENDRVRVLEAGGSPGLNTGMHSHPHQVAIALADTSMKFTFPGGESAEAELKAGEVMYLDPVEHAVELLGSGEGRLILVELK
jgi:quercetin dioxygenase-like cupin family protein